MTVDGAGGLAERAEHAGGAPLPSPAGRRKKAGAPGDLVILLDPHGRVTYASRKQPGVPAAAVGQPGTLYVGAEHRPALEAAIRAVFAKGEPRRLDATGPEGGEAEYRIRLLPIVYEGVVTSAVGILSDRTWRERLERHVLEIAEREQERIGRDLHDGVCQEITAACLAVSALENELRQNSRPEAPAAARIAEWLRRASRQSQLVARGLISSGMEDGGLARALREMAANAASLPNIDCRFIESGNVSLDDGNVAVHLYRIAQEALSNALRHGLAKDIRISFGRSREGLTLTVEDDGVGFVSPASGRQGMGLHTMRYRARAIGGQFHIRNTGAGTAVSCSVAWDGP